MPETLKSALTKIELLNHQAISGREVGRVMHKIGRGTLATVEIQNLLAFINASQRQCESIQNVWHISDDATRLGNPAKDISIYTIVMQEVRLTTVGVQVHR